MARLSRVHMCGIGTEVARFSPLTLDFRDRSRKVNDGVIWLRNGGGKTCWLSLFYSVFSPRASSFLLKKAKSREASITDFVRGNDLAFIITEWEEFQTQQDGELISTERVRVIGRVMAWRGLQPSADRTNLKNLFFSFRCTPKAGFEHLPILGLSSTPSKSFEDFRDWLHDFGSKNPHLEVVVEHEMNEWESYLERIGFDPGIFRFQVLMNQREGDIDQYFKEFCSTSVKFTREFLKLAHDPQQADQLTRNLIELRSKLTRRGPLEHEQTFIQAFLAELGPFRIETDHFNSIRQTLGKLQREARGLQMALEENLQRLSEQLRNDKAFLETAHSARQRALEAIGLHKAALAYFDVREAEIKFLASEEAHQQAKTRTAISQENDLVAKAAIEYAALRKYQTTEQALTEAVAAEQQRNLPILEELKTLGTAYRASVDAQRHNAETEERSCDDKAATIRERITNLDRTVRSSEAEKVRTETRKEQIDQKLSQRNARLQTYSQSGLIQREETPAAASERIDAQANQVRELIATLEDERDKLLAHNETLSREKEEILRDKAESDSRLKRKRETIARSETMQRALLGDRTLLELTNGAQPDLGNPMLGEGLKARADAETRSILSSEVDDAEDRRALSYVEAHGLLPPSRDVETLLLQLKSKGVASFSGYAYLAECLPHPEKAIALLRTDPARFTGVMVNTPELLERVRTNESPENLKGPVSVSVTGLDAVLQDEHTIVLPPTTSGAFNRSAAAAEKEIIQIRTERRKRQQEEARATIREIERVQRELQAFLQEFGAGKLEVLLQERDKLDEAIRLLDDQASDKETQRSNNSNRIREINKFVPQHQQTLTGLQNSIRILGQFIQDYEKTLLQDQQQSENYGAAILRLTDEIREMHATITQLREDERQTSEQRIEWKAQRTKLSHVLESILYFSDEQVATATTDPDQARASYEAQLQVYNSVSASQLNGQLTAVKIQVAEQKTKYEKVRGKLDPIRIQAFAQEGNIQLRADAAVQSFAKAKEAETEAHAQFRVAQQALDLVRRSTGKSAKAPEGVQADTLEIVAEGRRQASEALAVASTAQNKADEMATRLGNSIQKIQEHISARSNQKEILDSLELGDMAASSDIVSGLPEDDESIRKTVRGFKSSISDAELNLKRVDQSLNNRFASILEILRQPDPKGCDNAMKTKLKEVKRDALMHTATELNDSAAARSAIISAELASIKQDHDAIALQMRIVYDSAFHTLKAAERVSRLPDSMGAWASQPFLQIKVTDHGEAELNVKLGDLLDTILDEEGLPDGNSLAFRCIHHVAGEDGLRVTILKPDVVLRAERLNVEDMAIFSGGEGVTAAILLYCTLLQLRAQNKGRVQRAKDAGFLILDNPMGKCSRTDFLRMHRQIAAQMNVQLIYLTGVNDVSAIGTFEHIIRLKNRHRNAKTGDSHVTMDYAGPMEAARIAMENL